MRNLAILVCLRFALWSKVVLAITPPGEVVAWGDNASGQATGVPSGFWAHGENCSTGLVTIAGLPLTDAIAVAAGRDHSLALRRDGTVVGWGCNGSCGIAIGIPTGDYTFTNGPVVIGGRVLSNVTAIAAGDSYSLALRSDGTAISWGADYSGPINRPLLLSNVLAIAGGARYDTGLALQRDGVVVGFSKGTAEPIGISNAVAIAASSSDFWPALALKRDGRVEVCVAEGSYPETTPPPGLSNVVAIAAGYNHYLALKKDGTVFGWGGNANGQVTGVPSLSAAGLAAPGGTILSNVVAIAAWGEFSLALRADGKVVAWGRNGYGQTDVPAGLSNVVAIAAGYAHCLAITTNAASFMK